MACESLLDLQRTDVWMGEVRSAEMEELASQAKLPIGRWNSVGLDACSGRQQPTRR